VLDWIEAIIPLGWLSLVKDDAESTNSSLERDSASCCCCWESCWSKTRAVVGRDFAGISLGEVADWIGEEYGDDADADADAEGESNAEEAAGGGADGESRPPLALLPDELIGLD